MVGRRFYVALIIFGRSEAFSRVITSNSSCIYIASLSGTRNFNVTGFMSRCANKLIRGYVPSAVQSHFL